MVRLPETRRPSRSHSTSPSPASDTGLDSSTLGPVAFSTFELGRNRAAAGGVWSASQPPRPLLDFHGGLWPPLYTANSYFEATAFRVSPRIRYSPADTSEPSIR